MRLLEHLLNLLFKLVTFHPFLRTNELSKKQQWTHLSTTTMNNNNNSKSAQAEIFALYWIEGSSTVKSASWPLLSLTYLLRWTPCGRRCWWCRRRGSSAAWWCRRSRQRTAPCSPPRALPECPVAGGGCGTAADSAVGPRTSWRSLPRACYLVVVESV